MELVYAALLLHSIGKPVDEASIKKTVTAAGGKADDAQIKALVANLKDINIDDAIKQASVAPATPQAVEEKREEKPKQDEKKAEEKAEEAAAGLGSLFG
jgi:large subunit ribosomal protein L12